MDNPWVIATKGKGFLPMLSRAGSIAIRYGFTPTKMEYALKQLTDVLLEFGCHATLPVTACTLARNHTMLQKVKTVGVELAIHGQTHVDYTQLSFDHQCHHFHCAQQIFEKAGFSPSGFRSPYLRWNSDTLDALLECGIDYDSSQALAWDVVGTQGNGNYAHVLDFYGAKQASLYPSLPWLEGNLVRIPYCLPDDEALVERLKILPGQEMSEIWLEMLDRIYTDGELFTLGLHPERILFCNEALRAVLNRARSLSPSVWIARLSEIAEWYRSLGKSTFTAQPQSKGSLRFSVNAPGGTILLARNIDVDAPKQVWAFGYEEILSNEFVIRGEMRPWIGLAPESAPRIRIFLQHQGYLVETSTDQQAFPYYFSQRSFQSEDERSLIVKIESGSQPLLKLGRWPHGARAALAVTGDVDALTMWDYGLRVINR